MALQGIFVNLQIRELVPSFMLTDDYKYMEQRILLAIIVIGCVNYSSYKATLYFNVLFMIPAIYFAEKGLLAVRYDPYSKEPLSENPSHLNN